MSPQFRIICTCQTLQDYLHMSAHFRIICTCQHTSGSSAHVTTIQDHLHMSNTSRLSAQVRHLNMICTGQPQLHCTRHAQETTHTRGFAFNTESLWRRSVLFVPPCPCWKNISSRQVQHLHKHLCSQCTEHSQAFTKQQRHLAVKSNIQSLSDLHCMSHAFARDDYTMYFHASLLECVT